MNKNEAKNMHKHNIKHSFNGWGDQLGLIDTHTVRINSAVCLAVFGLPRQSFARVSRFHRLDSRVRTLIICSITAVKSRSITEVPFDFFSGS